MEHEHHGIDRFFWDRICEHVDAEADRDTPFFFDYGPWKMGIGPRFVYNSDGHLVGVHFEFHVHCALPKEARLAVVASAREAFGKFLAPAYIPLHDYSDKLLVPLTPKSCQGFNEYIEVYDRGLAFFAALGGAKTNAFVRQLDHNLSELNPKCSAGESSSKGRLTSDLTPEHHAEFSTTLTGRDEHSMEATFSLPSSETRFDFESSSFPFKKFDKIKVGHKLCDDAFYFHNTSSLEVLQALVPPLSSLAALGARLHLQCAKEGTLTLHAKKCPTLSVVPTLAAVCEIWRYLVAQAIGFEDTARASPLVLPIQHDLVLRPKVELAEFL